jgi:uncharacterized protein YegP (UPF0339 family)
MKQREPGSSFLLFPPTAGTGSCAADGVSNPAASQLERSDRSAHGRYIESLCFEEVPSMSVRAWSGGLVVLVALLVALVGVGNLVPGQLRAAQAGKSKMKFEVYQDAAKEYRWRLKAANGEILATAGQGYKAKADCKTGVERIQEEMGKGSGSKYEFEVYQDKAKEYRWRLKASNGQIVAASSEGYKTKADCQKAIDLIKKGAAKAEVEDKT